MDEHEPTASPSATAPSEQELSVATVWQGDHRIVTATGQIDLTNTHRLHYALSTALHHGTPLIADLTGVTFLDSHGLRTLLIMQRNADLQAARLIIVPSPEIATLIALAGAQALNLHPSLATALVAARQDPTAASHDTPAPTIN